jgi:hypothetical protein
MQDEKIIQIATYPDSESEFGRIFALTNRGRMFEANIEGKVDWVDFDIPEALNTPNNDPEGIGDTMGESLGNITKTITADDISIRLVAKENKEPLGWSPTIGPCECK